MSTVKAKPKDVEVARSTTTDLLGWNSPIGQFVDNIWRAATHGDTLLPKGELEETDDAFIVELDVPGTRKKDIAIDVAGRRVSVKGTREAKERSGVLRHSTRTTGEFSFDVVLPSDVDESGTSASLNEGVLRIQLPKNTKTPSHKVAIS